MKRFPNYHYRKAWLRAFWMIQVLLTGSSVTTAAWLLKFEHPLTWGMSATVFLLVPGMLKPSWVSLPFRIWRECESRACGLTSAAVAAVCYVIVVLPMGRLMGGFSTVDYGERGWVARVNSNTIPDAHPGTVTHRVWARATEPPLVLAVTPFLHILRWIGGGEGETEIPVDTYTLY